MTIPEEIGINKSKQIIESLNSLFLETRNFWVKKIKDHTSNFKTIEKITELQAELFYDRQIILEQKHKLYEKLIKRNNDLTRSKKNVIIDILTKTDIKFTAKDKDICIDSELSEKVEISQIIENHINYLEQTIKTIDNIIYGIKYRLNLYEITNA